MIEPIYPGRRVGWEVNPVTGCWDWRGAKQPNGYGVAGLPGQNRTRRAHRIVYERLHGAVPVGFELDHLCRNRGCVNPGHLEVVDRRTNARRGLRSKLTIEAVKEIRARYAAGGVTLSDLAAEHGVHNSTINRAITGRRGVWRIEGNDSLGLTVWHRKPVA